MYVCMYVCMYNNTVPLTANFPSTKTFSILHICTEYDRDINVNGALQDCCKNIHRKTTVWMITTNYRHQQPLYSTMAHDASVVLLSTYSSHSYGDPKVPTFIQRAGTPRPTPQPIQSNLYCKNRADRTQRVIM